ncbi:MAG: ABC transporter ATP-binding protein [Pseudomonadota bacterium]
MTAPLLAVENLTARYGPSQVLFDVSLAVAEGEILALMGRNGMGKTTTIRAISRLVSSTAERLEFSGQDITPFPAHRAARLGLGLVPEGRRCFPNLTVYENCLAGARAGNIISEPGRQGHAAWDFNAVTQLFPRLGERRDQNASTLSGGEQQMLAIGRALMTNPKLLLLDEATEGLAPTIRREIWDAIAGLKKTGLSIIIVDKTLSEILALADRCTVLEKGCVAWEGNPKALTPDIATRFLGV